MTTPPSHVSFPSPPDYAPFKAGPFRLSMGIMPLNLNEWIEPDTHFAEELKEKERLLTERYGEVFAVLPEAAASAAEVLALLVGHLPTRFPELYKSSGDRIENLATGQHWEMHPTPLHPLDLAGRLVQEDLCLMQWQADTRVYHLVGASLCFPTRWRLADKFGQPLNTIHAPIPGYEEQLAPTMDRFFERLKVEKPVWRLNWSLMDDPTLFSADRAWSNRAQCRHHARECRGHTLAAHGATDPAPSAAHKRYPVHHPCLRQTARAPCHAAGAHRSACCRPARPPAACPAYKSLAPFIEAVLTWLDRATKKAAD